jgi:hypothetical protein
MSTPIVVTTDGPLILVTYYGAASNDQYAAYLQELTAITQRNERATNMVVINDATRWIRSNAEQRRMQADWIAKNAEVLRGRTAGVSFVISSAVVRGGLTAILWLSNMPCPYRVTATLEESVQWARELQGAAFPAGFAANALQQGREHVRKFA